MPEYIQFNKSSTPISSSNADKFILQIDSNNKISLVDNNGIKAIAGEQTIESTIPTYYALLTQSGSSSGGGIYNVSLTIGRRYTIIDDEGYGWDFTNVGAPNNFNNTVFIATGRTPNSWGVGTFLEYNECDPLSIIQKNTLGFTPFWQRNGAGMYGFNFDIVPDFDKVTVSIPSMINGNYIYPLISNIYDITINTKDGDNNNADGILNNVPIEIKIYP